MLHARKVLKEAPSFQTSTTEEINGANGYHLSGKNQMSSQKRTKALLMEAGTVYHKNNAECREKGVRGNNKSDIKYMS